MMVDKLVADMFADRLAAGRFVDKKPVDTEADNLLRMKVDMSAGSKLSGAGCNVPGKAPYIRSLLVQEDYIKIILL